MTDTSVVDYKSLVNFANGGATNSDLPQPNPATSADGDKGNVLEQALNGLTNIIGSTVGSVVKPADGDGNAQTPAGSSAPFSGGATLDNLIKTGAYVSDQMKGVVGALGDVQKKVDQTTSATVDAQTKLGADTAVVEEAKVQSQIQQHIDNVRDASAAGTQPGVGSFITDKALANLRDETANRIDLSQKLETMKNTSILDDPLSWLVNQFKIPFAEDNLKQVQGDIDDNARNLGALQKATSDAGVRNAANDVAVNANVLAATTDAAVQDAAVKANAAKMQAASTNISVINSQMTATRDQFTLAATLNSSIVEQQKLLLSEGSFALAQKNFESEQGLRTVREDNVADALAQRQHEEDKISNMNTVFGTHVDPQDFRSMAPQEKAAVQNLMDSAQVTKNMSGGVIVQAGLTPFDAAKNLSAVTRTPDLGLDTILNKMSTDFSLTAAHNEQPGVNIGWQHATPQEKEAAYNGNLLGITIPTELKNIPSAGGYYSPAPLGATMKLPQIAQSPLGQQLKPLADQDPLAPVKASDVMQAAMTIAKTEGTSKAAAYVTDFYHNIMLNNNAVNKYSVVGLPMMDPRTTGFKQAINGKPIDMTNSAQVENYIKRTSLGQAAKAAAGGLGTDQSIYTGHF